MDRTIQPEHDIAKSLEPRPIKWSTRRTNLNARHIQWYRERMRILALRLSETMAVLLRRECKLELKSVVLTASSDYLKTLEPPLYLMRLVIGDSPRPAYMSIDSLLAIGMVDALLGGHGITESVPRPLSELEQAIIDKVVVAILDCWADMWKRAETYLMKFIAAVSDPTSLVEESLGEDLLIASFNITMGELTGVFSIAIPGAVAEQLVQEFFKSWGGPAEQFPKLQWHPLVEDIKVYVTVEWIELKFKTQQLASLSVGDIIWVDLPLPPAKIRIGSKYLFEGLPGIQANHWALELTKKISN